MLAKRLAVVVLLKEGLTQSEISRALNLTRVTVNKMELLLETRKEGYNIALRILAEEKLLAEFKDILVKLTKYSIRAAGGYVKPTIV